MARINKSVLAVRRSVDGTVGAKGMNSPVTEGRQMAIGYILLLSKLIVDGCNCEQCESRRYNIREMTTWLFD